MKKAAVYDTNSGKTGQSLQEVLRGLPLLCPSAVRGPVRVNALRSMAALRDFYSMDKVKRLCLED